MPKISTRFKFEYFMRGSEYSAKSEYQRFVTVDYNMQSYVGVIGVGIIEGWEIEQTTDREIQILPGKGIINGFFAESPYEIKRRTEMVSGEREADTVKLQQAPEEDMTDEEADTYISIIREYDPDFDPDKPIENAYIKAVIPTTITLPNEEDSYIWVTRKYSNYYPPLADYPSYLIPEPSINDYNTFSEYLIAESSYNNQMDSIYDYQFRDDSANHFTEVTFNSGTVFSKNTSKVLLGKVATRSNEVISVDTSEVNTLKNLESTITSYANKVITAHHHGGTEEFDPAKINLETDIRQAVLVSYNPESRKGDFSVVESQLTETTDGHRHTFSIDSDGNGQTVGIIGAINNHYHKIANSIIQTQEFTTETVSDHIHTLPELSNFTWDDTNDYIVYVNGIPVGDNDSDDISVNPTNETVSLTGIIGGITKTYGIDFEYNGTRFKYSEQQSGVFKFMLNAITAFNALFTDADINTNPFLFFDEDTGSISGITELKTQSITAEALLKEIDDKFVFTPNAGRNVEVTLLDYQKTVGLEADNVTIEILGNSEVQGLIKPENIFFINAQKVTSGIFEISQLPFLSHVGRTNESFSSFNYPLVSSNGTDFLVTPAATSVTSWHYHSLLLNSENSGQTENTFIDEDPILYVSTEDGNTYLVGHLHSVTNGTIADADSQGLLSWTNSVNESSETSSTHTHSVLIPTVGDVKTVYSMFEDRFNNLYVGTSDNLIMIPNDDAFIFVINDMPFYEIGTDLLTMFESAKQNYETQTKVPLKITSDIYTAQIALAEDALVSVGDSYLIIGKSESNSDADQTMIQKLSYVPVPNYKSTELKEFDEVGSDETLVGVQLIDKTSGAILDPESETVKAQIEDDPNSVKEVAQIEKYLDSIPAISIEVQEITQNGITNDKVLTAGSNIIATNENLYNSFYFNWDSPNTPSNVGIFKKAEQDEEGSVWIASNNGVLVLRSHNKSTIFSRTTRPGISPNIKDILVFTSDNVYCASDGIYKTEDQGKTWNKKLSGDFEQITQDLAAIKVLNNYGHTHTLNVNINGNGTLEEEDNHTHVVTNWTISEVNSHVHNLSLTLYATSSTNVYRSTDSGENWASIYELPDDENGNIFPFNNILYLSKPDGIYKYSGGWSKVSDIVAYSFQISYDLSSFFIGAVNEIYKSSGSTFESEFSFTGAPLPTLVINEKNKSFGYSYSNRNKIFYLNEITVTDQTVSSFTNFDKWFAENGSWDDDIKYDIFIDDKLILSTKTNVDNRLVRGWNFTVDQSVGLIDFSAETSLSSGVSVFDSFIEVDDASRFQAGDRILIKKTEESTNDITNPSTEQIAEAAVAQRKLDTTYLYVTISSISGNTISFYPKSTIKIDTPAKVYKIPDLDANSSIKLNIYDSFLSNIGENIHQDLEDKLSYQSDQRPYELNNSYLSNLLQLTQAVRYVYPEIDSKMAQSVFYDMHYSDDSEDDNYFGNYIDIENSEAYSLVNFQSPFEAKGATYINKVLIGSGTFLGNLIVGTDIGVFWAILDESVNTNWFYVWNLKKQVYDIQIFGEENLLVATNDGVYSTQDMVTWTLQDQEAVRFPAFSMSLRWPEENFTVVSSHTATFQNSDDDPARGKILTSGGIYDGLLPNKSIKIETLGDPSNPKNNTSYLITSVSPNKIEVLPSFENVPETITEVQLTIGSWWQQFTGEDNVGNQDLTNTLLVGGKNKIAYSPYFEDFVWTSGLLDSEIENINVITFLPLSIGGILASAVGTDLTNVVNYVLRSSDLGKVWSSYKKFEEVRGTVQSSKLSTFSHSILTVNYTYPNDFRYANGELDKRKISIFLEGQSDPIFDGKIIFNDGFDSTIVIFGKEANEKISENPGNLTFKVFPITINDMIEAKDNNILFGTDIGIYEDNQTTTGDFPFEGQVWSVGDPGRATNVDISGTIKSVSTNPANSSVILSVKSSSVISKDQFKDKKLYIVDLPVVTGFTISTNSSRTVGGEITIELENEFSSIWATYTGKNIKLVGDQSVIDVDFDFKVLNNQLKDGKIYVSSNENNNIGKTYTVVSNTSNQITIDESITPYNVYSPDGTNKGLIAGQSFIGIDSSGKVELDVTFTQDVVDNFLVDFSFYITNSGSQAYGTNGMTVYQNSRNKIVLNDFSSLITDYPLGLAIQANDSFRVIGEIFQPLSSFNNKKTSTELSHYHELNLVGGFIKGKISSFSEILSATVEFELSDTTLFDSDIVQSDGSLLEGARIRFYNPLQIGVEYFSEVVSHTTTTMKVKLLNNTNWDFTEYKQTKISTTWNIEVDATNYGFTNGTSYNDFITNSNIVTQDISINDSLVYVNDTSDMVINDKILIISSIDKSETNFIKSIVNSTTIELDVVASNSYFISNTVQVKVLRDEFSNTHEHMVRNNQVKTISVEDYLNRGLPSQHSHKNIALIDTVADMEPNQNDILIVGSSNFVYNSSNNGASWEKIVDLNDFVEDNLEIQGIISINSVSNRIVAGTSSGEIFSTGGGSSDILPLNQPEVN